MKLEEINVESLKKVDDKELLMLHLRMHQLFNGSYTDKERIVELHKLIVDEMKERGLNHNIVDNLDAYVKEIVVMPEFISLTGSIVYGKSEGEPDDVDIVVKAEVGPDGRLYFLLDSALQLKMERYFRNVFGKKLVHWIPTRDACFDHLHLFDLVLRPNVSFHKVEDERTQQVLLKQSTERDDEAKKSMREDKVVPGRYFYPLKTALDPISAYHKAEVFALDRLEEMMKKISNKLGFKDQMAPCIVQKKADGVNCQVHVINGKFSILSEGGQDWTSRVPRMKEAFESVLKGKDAVFIGEVEMWYEGKYHAPREDISGYMNAQTKVNDEFITINLHDCLYFGKDIHNEPYTDRLAVLYNLFEESEEIKFPVFAMKSYLCNNYEELRKAVEHVSNLPASEGAMIKILPFPYSLNGNSTYVIKFKKYADVHVIVLDVIPTKTEGVYNYVIGLAFREEDRINRKYVVELNGKEFMIVGKTFNSNLKLKPGDIITVHFHSMNLYIDKDGTQHLTLYETRIYEVDPEQTMPDYFKQAVQIGRESGLLREKIEKSAPTILVKSPLNEYPSEEGDWQYMVHMHAIGKGFHNDLRIQFGYGDKPDFLIGWTLNVKNPKEQVPFVIDSLTKAKKIANDPKYWKINWKTGEFISKTIASGIVRKANIWASPKEVEDLSWFSYEGEVKPGQVGAGVNVPGVFLIIDKGKVEYGFQNAWFHEYFFYGKLKGRHFFRLLPKGEEKQAESEDEEEFTWILIQPDDQRPYVISDSAVERGVVPPHGISALPSKVKQQIPKEFRYWEEKNESKRREIRDQLVKEIDAGNIEVDMDIK